ncbi:MAG: BMC domain-containing protein [Eubacterium sp.]
MQKSIGMVEYNSIARGIYASDQMVKVAEVEIVSANTVCPGKYISRLFTGKYWQSDFC